MKDGVAIFFVVKDDGANGAFHDFCRVFVLLWIGGGFIFFFSHGRRGRFGLDVRCRNRDWRWMKVRGRGFSPASHAKGHWQSRH